MVSGMRGSEVRRVPLKGRQDRKSRGARLIAALLVWIFEHCVWFERFRSGFVAAAIASQSSIFRWLGHLSRCDIRDLDVPMYIAERQEARKGEPGYHLIRP